MGRIIVGSDIMREFVIVIVFLIGLSGCGTGNVPAQVRSAPARDVLPGMPPVLDPNDIYSAGKPGNLSEAVKDHPYRLYVPYTVSNMVDVIDPATHKVLHSFPVEKEPQHVTPSWDLRWLWVGADLGNTLTKVDPVTGQKVETLPIEDPYNLYFTPDGKFAIVVAERMRRLDFRDAQTMTLVESVNVPCRGVDHMDFSADGRYVVASCEFSSEMVKVDIASRKYVGKLKLPNDGMPQDVKISPDGKLFYVADMHNHGMHVVDGDAMKSVEFIQTGNGCHGLYTSRDSKHLYISNRGEGTVSVMEFATRKLVAKWELPDKQGSPDMGGVSPDGKVLWLSGRYHKEIYGFDTTSGSLVARIQTTHRGPHGMCVWPQPGRYSLGHTGILR